MPDQTYLVPFVAKGFARKEGAVDIDFHVVAASAKAAADEGLRQLKASGEEKSDYFKPKPVIAPEQTPELYQFGESSTEECPPGAFSREPEPEPTGSNGGALTLDKLNSMIEALAVGERLILPEISESLYRPSTGYSTTNIKQLLQSCPAKMKAHMDGIASSDSAPKRLGRGVHCATLEPQRYATDYAVMPEGMSRRGKTWDEFKEANEGREIITHEENEKIKDMADAVITVAGGMFIDGVSELSGWLRISDKIVIKARADYFYEDADIDYRCISDLKSTQSCADEDIVKTCNRYLYHLQDHVYCKVFDTDIFVLVFVETESPYLVRYPVRFSDKKKAQAERMFNKAIDKLEECETLGFFDSYSTDELFIDLQRWEQ